MRVAVASEDGSAISRHFGRSACFVIYEIENSKIVNKEIRPNTFTAHAQGECHGDDTEHQPHSHSSIVNALHDCEAVLCYGMGWRAAQDLTDNGIKPNILDRECTPDEAVSLFLEGKLPTSEGRFCRCHE